MAEEKYPTQKELKAELAKGKIVGKYMFLGEEEGEKDKFILAIKNFMFQNNEEATVGRFHCENDEFMQAAEFALSQSMFSSKKLCILYNIDSIKLSRQAKTKSKAMPADEIITELPAETVLIATSVKNKPPAVFSPSVLKQFAVFQFWPYFDRDIQNYITAELKKRNFTVERGAIELLLARTGKDIRKIDEALEILVCSCNETIVKQSDIVNFVSDIGDASVYDFAYMLLRRDPAALSLYGKLTGSGATDVQIFSAILRQIEILEKFHSIADTSSSLTDAMLKCGVFKKKHDDFLQTARAFPKGKTGILYNAAAKADRKRKSGIKADSITSSPVFEMVTEILFGS